MLRLAWVVTGLLVAGAIAPTPVEAAVIQCVGVPDPACEIIGEFAWSRDDFDSDTFAVNNRSDLSSIPDEFSSLTLTLDPDPGFTPAFGADPLTAGATTEPVDLFSFTVSAQLTFLFNGTTFVASIADSDLVFDDAEGTLFFSRAILAREIVPEPSSLMLLASGLALGLARMRARR